MAARTQPSEPDRADQGRGIAEPSAAICASGCRNADACTGACQPAPWVSTGKRCRYCEQGAEIRNGEHWIVKSFRPPTIDIRTCVAVREAR